MFDTLGENDRGTAARRGMRVIWIVVILATAILVALALIRRPSDRPGAGGVRVGFAPAAPG